MKPQQLDKIREEIDQLDQIIINTLVARKKLVEQVAEFKKNSGLPLIVPEREKSLLAKRRLEAKSQGLNPDLIESILKRVMLSSYQNQSTSQFTQTNPKIKSIVIIGGQGKMGKLFTRFLQLSNYSVTSLEIDQWQQAAQLCADADCVILSVPIDATLPVINQLPPLKPSCLLADLTSIKQQPLDAMLQHHQGPVIGLHPMFGPDIKNFAKQVIVTCEGRNSCDSEWLIEQFRLWGALIKPISAQLHDKNMAIIQALRHFSTLCFGINLLKENPDLNQLVELSSPIYRIELAMVTRLFTQDPELYIDIIASNSQNLTLIKKFAKLTNELIELFESNQRDKIIDLFMQTRDYFGQTGEILSDESRDIIASMAHVQGEV